MAALQRILKAHPWWASCLKVQNVLICSGLLAGAFALPKIMIPTLNCVAQGTSTNWCRDFYSLTIYLTILGIAIFALLGLREPYYYLLSVYWRKFKSQKLLSVQSGTKFTTWVGHLAYHFGDLATPTSPFCNKPTLKQRVIATLALYYIHNAQPPLHVRAMCRHIE